LLDRFAGLLDRFATPLACPDADTIIHREDKNLAVADFTLRSGTTAFHDRFNRGFDKCIVDGNFKPDFSQKIHGQIVTAIRFGMPLLSTESLHVHQRESKYFNLCEGCFDRFKTIGLNDGDDQFHAEISASEPGTGREKPVLPILALESLADKTSKLATGGSGSKSKGTEKIPLARASEAECPPEPLGYPSGFQSKVAVSW
jgi:hypothetical protein